MTCSDLRDGSDLVFGTLDNGNTLDVISGSTLNAGSLVNTGTLKIDAGSSFIVSGVENDGSFNVNSGGELDCSSGFTNGSGTLTLASGVGVDFNGSDLDNAGTIIAGDDISFDGVDSLGNAGQIYLGANDQLHAGATLENEGTLSLGSNSSVDVEMYGQLDNQGTLNLTDGAALTVNGGTVDNTGGNIDLTNTTFSTDGDTFSGTLSADSDSTVINTGTLNLSTAITSGYLVLASGATLDNQGTLETDANVSLQGVNLENEGSLNVNSGTLSVSGSIVESSGTATIASGAELDLDDGTTDGEYDFSAVTNSGIFHVLGGTAIVSELTGTGNTLVDAGATLIVPPAAPTDLSATVASSTEIDLSWNGVTSSFSTGYVIYESTDGTGYDPIDEVTTDTTSYQATDLTPGSGYWFKVSTDGEAGESAASNWVHQATTFLPPTINVTGDDTVTEGQPYELQLSADYADGEPGAISGWTVSWGDGSTNSTFSTATVDTTHTFASAVDSPTISITAIDSQGSYTASQDVSVIPAAPTGLTVAANGSNEIDLSWTNHSAFSDGTIILMSTDGESYFQLDEAPAGATTYAATGLSADATYSFEIESSGSTQSSAASSSASQPLGYVPPTLTVTPQTPTENQSLTLALSSSYANNVSSGDVITQWMVDWGVSGLGVQTYSGSSMTASSPAYYPSGTSSAQVNVTAMDASGRTFDVWNQTVQFAPVMPSGTYANYDSGNASATVGWSDNSSIVDHYLVQRSDHGSNWTTADTVPAVNGQTSYIIDDGGLSPAINESGNGYIYRVIAVSAAGTASVPGDAAAPANGNPTLTYGTAYENSNGNVSAMPGVSGGLSPAAFTLNSDGVSYTPVAFASGDTVTFTVTGLTPHMWYNFSAGLGTNSGAQTGDSLTVTGPHNTDATYIQNVTGFGIGTAQMNILDDGNDTSATFTVQVTLPGTTFDGQPRTWSFGYVIIAIGKMDVGSGVGLRLGGGEGSDGFPNAPGAGAIVVGGMDYKPVRLNHDYEGPGINETINLIGYDSSLIEPLALSEKTDAGGWAYFPIKAISAAATGSTAQLVFADNIGDQAVVEVPTCLPLVDVGGSVTDGRPSDTGDFTFSLPNGPSAVAVNVPFSTAVSTAHSTDYSGLPSGGFVTIPAGEESLDVPITATQDNLIKAPLYLDILADPTIQPTTRPAAMVINDINTPKVTIGKLPITVTTGATFPLDTENDTKKFVQVNLSAPTRNGDQASFTLSWSPELLIWDSDTPDANAMASRHDIGWYQLPNESAPREHDFVTWSKLHPTVYAQAIGGSQWVNSTGITLTAEVKVAATTTAPATEATPSGTATGTAAGVLIEYGGSDVTGKVAGDVLIGQGVSISCRYVGPGDSSVPNWLIGPDQASKRNPIDGLPPVPLQWPDDFNQQALHFYWTDGPALGKSKDETISVIVATPRGDYTASTHFNLWAPTVDVHNSITRATDVPTTTNGVANPNTIGDDYSVDGTVTLKSTPFNPSSGTFYMTQLIDVVSLRDIPWWLFLNYSDSGLDLTNPYSAPQGSYPTDIPSQNLWSDHAGSFDSTRFNFVAHFQDYLMFEPKNTSDWVAVPLEKATFNEHIQYDSSLGWPVGLLLDAPTKTDFAPTTEYPFWTNVVTFRGTVPTGNLPPAPHS